MKVDIWLCAMVGLASASALMPRDPQDDYSVDYADKDDDYKESKSPGYPTKYPEDDYPDEYKQKDYDDDYEEKGYPVDDYPKDDYPKDDYPKDDYPKDDYPKDDYPTDDYDDKDKGYPTDDYKKDYPTDDYKPQSYPKGDYKPNEYPTDIYQKKKEYDDWESKRPSRPWKPKARNPSFFSLKVDDQCTTALDLAAPQLYCPFDGYAIRLEAGIVIATPYNKWYDPKLPIFMVDDDTKAYTVSKKALELFVDSKTGALRYVPVGWLPSGSIATSFYKTGSNPLGKVDPSPAYFSWPITEGRATAGDQSVWWLCPLSETGQYQVFISDINFGKSLQGGVFKAQCSPMSLAAINANPWSRDSY